MRLVGTPISRSQYTHVLVGISKTHTQIGLTVVNDMAVAVITGANRSNGIGLALVKEFAEAGYDVVGTYRDPFNSDSLIALSKSDPRVTAFPLDVTSDESVSGFVERFSEVFSQCDVLVNNSGMSSSPGTMVTSPVTELEVQLQVHAIGPVRLTQAMLPYLRRPSNPPAKVAVITSTLGTMSGIGSGWTHYAPAKAAANALVRQMSSCLSGERVSMFSLHPGWVATDIGGSGAPISPRRSAQGLLSVITTSTMADACTFRDYRGGRMSW